jgi:hypothetical protein
LNKFIQQIEQWSISKRKGAEAAAEDAPELTVI